MPGGPRERKEDFVTYHRKIGEGLLERTATIYDEAKMVADESVEDWMVLAGFLEREAKGIREELEVTEVPYEPYADAVEQSAAICDGHLEVSSLYNEHPIWTPEQNIAFRLWHDFVGHHKTGLSFETWDEIAVYNSCKLLIPYHLRYVLFCESVAQIAFVDQSGGFGDQKIVDYRRMM